jgi:hypothetical protein
MGCFLVGPDEKCGQTGLRVGVMVNLVSDFAFRWEKTTHRRR